LIDLSILIVSWNVADLLAACLQSIGSPLGVEIIVVDSASSDLTVAMVKERFPQVKLLPQSENIGYTRGNNIGFQAAQGRYLLLLNPDTEMTGDALAQMVSYLEANPTVGIVGPRTLNTDGSIQSTRRRFPTLLTAFFESTWLESLAPKSLLDRYYVAAAADDSMTDVDWVQGSALMARREVYQQIGGLDEGYVMYSEEMDWCRRAKDAGWRVVYLGTAQIIHHGGKSTDQVAARRHIHFQQSKIRYFRKHHGWLAAQTLRVYLLVLYGWQLIMEGIKGLLGFQRPLRQERVRAYWQVLRSGLRAG
jgi:N-acetylglucosaminyl-diphospho-decaprenol L-rhamnosyltransferase